MAAHPAKETQALPAPQARTTRRSQVIALAVVLGLLGMVAWKLWQGGLTQVASGPAPDFVLTMFDTQTFRLSDQRGKVVVVNFWASWCIPCRQEAPVIESTWREYQDQGVVFVGVDYLDTETEARQYMTEFDLTYPNGPDVGTRIASLYRVKGVPETFFVNAAGQLRGVIIGPTNEAELHQRIDALLHE